MAAGVHAWGQVMITVISEWFNDFHRARHMIQRFELLDYEDDGPPGSAAERAEVANWKELLWVAGGFPLLPLSFSLRHQ